MIVLKAAGRGGGSSGQSRCTGLRVILLCNHSLRHSLYISRFIVTRELPATRAGNYNNLPAPQKKCKPRAGGQALISNPAMPTNKQELCVTIHIQCIVINRVTNRKEMFMSCLGLRCHHCNAATATENFGG